MCRNFRHISSINSPGDGSADSAKLSQSKPSPLSGDWVPQHLMLREPVPPDSAGEARGQARVTTNVTQTSPRIGTVPLTLRFRRNSSPIRTVSSYCRPLAAVDRLGFMDCCFQRRSIVTVTLCRLRGSKVTVPLCLGADKTLCFCASLSSFKTARPLSPRTFQRSGISADQVQYFQGDAVPERESHIGHKRSIRGADELNKKKLS